MTSVSTPLNYKEIDRPINIAGLSLRTVPNISCKSNLSIALICVEASVMDQRELLSSIPFLGNIEQEAVAILESSMQIRRFRKGQAIFDQGDPGDSLFLVSAGRVKIFVENEQGEQLTILFCSPGDCFGEMAVLDGGPRSASAEAMEPTETCIITREAFIGLMLRQPEVSLALISFLCAKLRTDLDRMEEFIFLDSYHRTGRQIMRMASEDADGVPIVNITQDELARLVGSSREQVNRVLGDLSSMGHIAISRGKIQILDKVAMEQMMR